jgi:Bacterial transglutaminase-like N-terminal region
MPIFSITHLTSYRYQRSVVFGEHRMMLRPRDDEDQKVIHADLAISPKPQEVAWNRDQFANHFAIARFSEQSNRLSFVSNIRLDHVAHQFCFIVKSCGCFSPIIITGCFCCCCHCGHVGNALALSIMSTAMRYACIVDGEAVPGASAIRRMNEVSRKKPRRRRYNAGSMQVRTLSRRYSSLRKP